MHSSFMGLSQNRNLRKHRLHRKPPLCKGRRPEGPEGLCASNRCQQRPLSQP